MPEISTRFAESAVVDLEALKSWYTEQGVPDVGNRFVEGILTRIEALRDHPEMGRIVPEFEQPFLKGIAPSAISHRLPPRSEARKDRARLAQRAAACASGR